MSTLIHLTLALGLVYLVICVAWWVIFWWAALDAEEQAQDWKRLEGYGLSARQARQAFLRQATYSRAQMGRFYLAPWLILTGQGRRNPPKHRH